MLQYTVKYSEEDSPYVELYTKFGVFGKLYFMEGKIYMTIRQDSPKKTKERTVYHKFTCSEFLKTLEKAKNDLLAAEKGKITGHCCQR